MHDHMKENRAGCRLAAVTGGGGKTSAMCAAAAYMKDRRVLITTTTHIFPVLPPQSRVMLADPSEAELMDALGIPGIVCAGVTADKGRLGALDPGLMKKACGYADITVCEADGSAGRPLKLHRDDEPVIPEGADICLIVAGLSAAGRPVSESVHRYHLNAAWAEDPDHETTYDDIKYCIMENAVSCGMPSEKIRVLLNQIDAAADPGGAEMLAEAVRAEGLLCMTGSLHDDSQAVAEWLLG